jgi:hypothetical protein
MYEICMYKLVMHFQCISDSSACNCMYIILQLYKNSILNIIHKFFKILNNIKGFQVKKDLFP